jgi:hypothetical protein
MVTFPDMKTAMAAAAPAIRNASMRADRLPIVTTSLPLAIPESHC